MRRSSRPSPRRRPLHERSDSQNNELPTTTVRLVESSNELTSRPYSSRSSRRFSWAHEASTVSEEAPSLYQHGVIAPRPTTPPPPPPGRHPSTSSFPVAINEYDGHFTSSKAPTELGRSSNVDATEIGATISARQGQDQVDPEARSRLVEDELEPGNRRSGRLATADSIDLNWRPMSLASSSTVRRPEPSFLRQEIRPAGQDVPRSSQSVRAEDVGDAPPPIVPPDRSSGLSTLSKTVRLVTPADSPSNPMRQARTGRTPPSTASYSAFPPASPPPVPIQFPPPLSSFPVVADVATGSPTAGRGPARSSIWRKPLPGPARPIKQVAPTFATRHRAPAAVALKRGSQRYSGSFNAPDNFRMNDLPPAPSQVWDGGRRASGNTSTAGLPRGDEDRLQRSSPSRSPSPPELVGIAITSDLEEPRRVVTPAQGTRRASTIRLISGSISTTNNGSSKSFVDNHSEHRPPTSRGRDMLPRTRDSFASTNFPEWAR